ncbi:MAG: aerobic-type carbon monoxide dehydrogenase, middle subunit CoxM/CutM-like protein [Sporomusa sp.]|nr:aerobic-type carbon monoxide dehydrogenase, middle subunit CoxM/CutM-like protein [Sporomusa sp.]
MSKFKYVRAESLQQAVQLIKENSGYYLIAGGTDLMVKLKEKLIDPVAIVDISRLEELGGITWDNGRITIGAAVTHSQVYESAVINRYAPALAKAAGLVGSPQIRNTGTIGGNIGNASPAADTVPVLIAYGAQVKVATGSGIKEISLSNLFTGPGRTVLEPGEIIVAITFQAQQPGQSSSFQKLGKRKALAIAVVNAAVWLEVEENTRKVTGVRLALGSVAATVIRATEAESILLGQVISHSLIQQAADKVVETVKPIDDVRSEAVYRQQTAGVLIKRALEEAWAE